jgi:hypothetical protein
MISQTIDVNLALFAEDTCHATERKESYVLRKFQRGLNSMAAWSECWNIQINEDKTILTMNGRNIPFVNIVKYLGVILDKETTWRPHIEMI